MSVRWKHKPFLKENNAQGLCLGLAGAGFFRNTPRAYPETFLEKMFTKGKRGDISLSKISFLILGVFVLIGFIYLVAGSSDSLDNSSFEENILEESLIKVTKVLELIVDSISDGLVRLVGVLKYENDTLIEGEELKFYNDGDLIGDGITDSEGEAKVDWDVSLFEEGEYGVVVEYKDLEGVGNVVIERVTENVSEDNETNVSDSNETLKIEIELISGDKIANIILRKNVSVLNKSIIVDSDFETAIVAMNLSDISSAEIRIPKIKNVDVSEIWKCGVWDFGLSECSSGWDVYLDDGFEQDEEYVWFELEEFSAYVGVNLIEEQIFGIGENETAVEKRYIVILEDREIKGISVSSQPEDVRKKIDSLQKDVLKTLNKSDYKSLVKYNVVPAFSAVLSDSGVDKLKKHQKVKEVIEDPVLHVSMADSVGIINADDVWGRQVNGTNLTGAGQSVCVIDTGINYNHSDLGGCFGAGCKVIDGYDYCAVDDSPCSGADSDPMDVNSHGSHVAGSVAANGGIKGVAPDANLIAMKACNSAGDCAGSAMLSAIDWCVANASVYNISVITMSIGDETEYDASSCPTWIDSAIDSAFNAGIFVSIASGNEGFSNGISYPACSPNAVSVGASTKADVMASYTNTHSSLLDLLAPGSSITSTCFGQLTCLKSGTSMATPHVAGAAALIYQDQELRGGNASPDNVKEALQSTGVSVDSWKRIDVNGAIDYINSNFGVSAVQEIDSVVLNSTSGRNVTSDNLTVYTDQDSNASVKLIYDWQVDNGSIALIHMPFDGFNGTVKDYSKYSHTIALPSNDEPTYNSTGGFDGKGAMYFPAGNGDERITIDAEGSVPLNDNLGSQMTLSMWVYFDGTIGSNDIIYQEWDHDDDRWQVGINGTGNFYVFDDIDNNEETFASNFTLVTNTWYHLVVVGDERDWRMYVNGNLVMNETSTDGMTDMADGGHDSRHYFGARRLGDPAAFELEWNGFIDEVMIFNRSLGQEQINAIYNNQANVIVNQETNFGETWEVCVTPNDNVNDGDRVCSGNLTIVTVPIENVTLNTSSGNNLSLENLIVSWEPEDDSARKSVPIWSLNGENITTSYFTFDGGALDNNTKFKNYGSSKQNITCYSDGTTVVDCDSDTDYYFVDRGRDGKGVFDFDENNDHMRLAEEALPTENFTISLWTYFQSGGTFSDAIFMAGNGSSGDNQELALFFVSSNNWDVWIDGVRTMNDVGSAPGQDVWKHIVITRDANSGNVSLYKDGSLMASAIGSTATLSYGGCDMMFGLDSDNGCYGSLGNEFGGRIDDIMIMEVVMTPEQVLEVYNTQSNNLTNFEINSTMTSIGQNWSVCATPNEHNNGIGEDGAEVCSNNLEILSGITFENVTIIDEGGSTVSFVNSSGDVNTTGEIIRGTNATFNVTITNTTEIDKVWIKIWQGAIDGAYLFWGYLTNIVDDLWQIVFPTNSSFNNTEYNYTIYANISSGEEDSFSATFNMSRPRIDGVVLNSSLGTNFTSENLTANPINLTPSDVKLIYDWRLENESIAVLNMPFEGGAICGIGNNLTCDYSDSGNSGTVIDAVYNLTGGHDGKGAYEFDGAGDYIDLGMGFTQLDGVSEFSVALWAYDRDDGTFDSWRGLFAVGGTSDRAPWIMGTTGVNSITVSFETTTGGVGDCEIDAGTIVDYSWNFVVVTWDGETCKLYINNTLVASDTTTGNVLKDSSGSNFIGTHANGDYWDGAIDEVVVWGRSLSVEQINAIYNDRTDLIVSQETKGGETWSVEVTPNDGNDDEVSVMSNNLTINLPSIDGVVLNSSLGENTTAENLTALGINESYNTEKLIYDWRKNGESIAVVNMPFEGGAICGIGNNLTCDYSSYGNNGAVNRSNYNLTGGHDGKGAYEFDGTNDSIDLGDVDYIDGNGEYTVSAWIYVKGYKRSGIISDEDAGSGMVLQMNASGYLQTYISGYQTSNYKVPLNEWVFITQKQDSSGIYLMINGTDYIEKLTSSTVVDSNHSLRIGSHEATGREFNGSIDEVKIFGKALGDEQINALYNNRTNLIVMQETTYGENWSVAVTPNDGTADGASILSNNLTIASLGIVLNSSLGLSLTTENLTANPSSVGDEKLIYDWRENGTSIAVLNMPFDSNVSSTASGAVKDYSTYGNNGTLGNGAIAKSPVWNSTGKIGGAYEFDGSNDYIDLGMGFTQLDGVSEFSVTLWAYDRDTGTFDSHRGIFHRGDSGARAPWINGYSGSNQIEVRFGTTTGGEGDCEINAGTIVDNAWNFVVVTWDGEVCKLYINNTFIASNATAGNVLNDSGGWNFIGAHENDDFWKGAIDEVMVFDRALSPEQISALYNNRTDLIVSNETSMNETWSVCGTPNDNSEDGTEVCSNNLTILADLVGPSIFNLVPAANTTYNISTTIEIGANVTDGSEIDSVLVNVTMPDETIEQLILNLTTGNWYNNSFSIPAMIGQYNITFIANDTFNNLNTTETTFFVGIDLNAPSVTDLNITPTTLNQSDNVTITVNVTDNVEVDIVLARITYPNLVDYDFVMSNVSSIYNYTFADTSQVGTYVVTIVANDTSNNINNSVSDNFIVQVIPGYGNSTTTIITPSNSSIYNVSDEFSVSVNSTAVGGNLTDCNVSLAVSNSAVLNITTAASIYKANFTANESKLTYFNVTTISVGTSNITATTACLQGGSSYDDVVNISGEDATAPTISIISPTATNYANVTILVNITSDGDNIWYNWNGTNISYSSAVNVVFAEGGNTLTAYANDTAGNLNSTSVTFTVDTTAPTLTIDSPINGTYNNETILVFITSDGDNVWYNNGTANFTYTAPVNLTFAEGSHTLTAWANDTLGNIVSQNVTFSVNFSAPDTIPPTLVINNPENTTYTNATILVNLSGFDLNLDSVWFNNGTANITYSTPTYVTFSEGSHTLTAWANDTSNNTNTKNITFTVDTITPTISIISPTATNYTNATILVNITSDGDNIWYNWNGTNVSYSSATNVVFAEGSNTLTAYANDTSGNLNSTSVTFIVDTTVPAVFDLRPVQDTTYNASTAIEISANVTDNVEVNSVIANITLPNGTIEQLTLSSTLEDKYNNSYTIPYVAGIYNVIFIANDSLGNINSTETTYFNVLQSLDAVILNSTLGTNLTSENLTAYAINATDNSKLIYDWKKDGSSIAVLNMPFEGGSNSSWTKDYSEFGNNGTVNGSIYNATGGQDGLGAYEFDGVNDSITVPHDSSHILDATTGFAISAWVKTSNNVNQDVVGKFGGQNPKLFLYLSSGKPMLYATDDNSNTLSVLSDAEVSDGEWHHVVGVWNPSANRGEVYIDGVLNGSSSASLNTTISNTATMYIGSRDTGIQRFNGTIDELMIFNKSLSAEQIAAMYNNGSYRTDLIVMEETTYGENWSVEVTPNDGTVDGLTKVSSILTIEPLSVVLNSSLGTNLTTENLTVYPSAVGDEKLIYDWKKDGSSIAVLNMPFEGGSNSSWTNDYTDGRNNGTVTEAIWNSSGGYDGKGAYEFDGVDDSIEIDYNQDFNFSDGEGFTVMTWMNPNDLVNNRGDMVSHYRGFADYRIWILEVYNGEARFTGCSNGSDVNSCERAYGTSLVNDSNIWYHLAGSWNGTHLQVYVNGVAEASTPPALASIHSTDNRGIRLGHGATWYNGSIDDVMIFNRTLSEEQIAAIYNNRTDLIVSQETTVGDVWKVEATPNDGSSDGTSVLSNDLTIQEDVNPSVFDLRPIANVTYNVSDIIEVGANVTDNFAMGVVLANITIPNGTITQLTLNNTNTSLDWYNWSYTIPDVIGQYNITFIANDSFNNVNLTETTFFVGQDVVDPSVFDLRPVSNITYNISSTIEIGANVTDDVGVDTVLVNITMPNEAITQLTLNNTLLNWYNWSYTIPDVIGQYNVTFIANDTSNNVNLTETTFFVGADAINPQIEFVNLTADGNYSQTYIDVNVTASDNVAIDTITINLYNSTGLVNSTTSSSSPFSYQFSGLSDGTYYLNATVNDTSSNINSTETRTIILDTTAPNVTITSPANHSQTSDATPEISFNLTDNVYTALTYEIYVDGSLTSHSGTGSTTAGVETTITILASMSLGDHNITIEGIDGSNNAANQTINLSIVPPVVYLTSPAYNGILNSSNVTFTFNVTDTNYNNLTCDLYINDVLNQTNGTTLTDTPTNFVVNGISEGLNQNWTVNCTNPANVSSADTWPFGIDTTYPLINFTDPTTASGNYSQTYIDVNVTASDNVAIDMITINLYNSTGLVNSTTSSSSPFTYQFSGLVNGTYYLNATVNDTSNNINSTETRTIIFDTTSPAVFALVPANGTTYGIESSITISANVTDNIAVDSVLANITYPDTTVQQITLANTIGDKYSNTFSIPSLNGTYDVVFIVNDTYNNINATEVTQFEAIEVVSDINNVECSNDSINYYSCTNMTYNMNITHIRVNCTARGGNVSGVSYNLYNVEDTTNYIDNQSSTYNSSDYYIYNSSYYLQDSGDWNLTIVCSVFGFNITASDTDVTSWSLAWGTIVVNLIDPIVDTTVQIYEFFTFDANVTCTGGECGVVNVTLDPEEVVCEEIEGCIDVSVGEECVNENVESCNEECDIEMIEECVEKISEFCENVESCNEEGNETICEINKICEDILEEVCNEVEKEVCVDVNCTEEIVESCNDILEQNCTIELICENSKEDENIGDGGSGGAETGINKTIGNEIETPENQTIIEEPEDLIGEEFVEGEILETEEGKDLGEKTEDELEYETHFLLMEQNDEEFRVIFYHDFNGTLPIRIEGEINYTLAPLGVPQSTAFGGNKIEADYLENVSLIVELSEEGILPQFELHIGEESEVFTFGKVIPVVELKQGNYTLIDRDDLKLDVLVDFENDESIILRGLEDEPNINVTLGTNSQQDVSSSIIAVPSLNIENATIILEKTKGVNAIIMCDDENFDYESLECSNWRYAGVNINNETENTIEFNVEHFTAYAGGNLTAGETAFLTIWDYNDVGMPNTSTNTTNIKIANETIEFFADYELARNGTKLSDGNCSISFSDSAANMTYNSTYNYFLYERNFTSNGAYTYTVSCIHSTYTDLSASDNIVIGQFSNQTKGAVSMVEGDVPFYTTSDNPQNCTLRGGETCNVTWQVNATGILNKIYDFFVEVVGDIVGYTNSSHLDITISVNDTTSPVVVWGGANSSVVFNGSEVIINANVEDNVQTDSVWGVVTHPSSFNTSFVSVPYNFTNTTESGRYNLTFYANDTNGNNGTTTSWFEVGELLNATINVSVDIDVDVGENISSNFTFKLVHPDFGDVIYETKTNGSFTASVPNVVYDIMFLSVFNNTMNLTLRRVNLSANIGESIRFDKHKQASDYLVTYGIDTGYEFNVSELIFSYAGESYETEGNLRLWKCSGADYDFSGRSCIGSWADVTSGATLNTDGDYFEYTTMTFSGFAIKEYVAPVVEEEEEVSRGGGGGCPLSLGYEIRDGKCVKIENVTIPSQLFDITFTLEDFLIQNVDELSGVVTFESFGKVPTPVDLVFIILDESGNEIYRVESDITVTTEEVLRWNYETLDDLPKGKYTVILETLYNVDVFDEFRQEFEIGRERKGIIGKAIDWIGGEAKWWLSGVLGLLIIGGFIWWLVWKREA